MFARRLAPLIVVVLVALSLVPRSPASSTDGATFYGSLGGAPLNEPVVAFSPRPAGDGYVIAASDGGVFSFGEAPFLGSMGGVALNAPVVDVEMAADGLGYTMAATDGGVFTFGSSTFAGSLGAISLNQPIGGIVLHPSGAGYWLWAGDGGVFAFGTAPFLGSLGAIPLGADVVGMATTADGAGYWLATADGRVFAFGTARHFGDLTATTPPHPITALAAAPDGAGYALLDADAGVFTFGSAPFHGAVAGQRHNGTAIDLAYTPLADGYWILGSDGGIFTFPGTVLPPAGVPTLTVTTVVSGLTIPWDVGFLPDATMLFTERDGRLSAVVGGAVRLLAVPADVQAVGEGGMTGLAIDPDFATNRHVYTCMNTTGGDVRVVRWLLDAAVTSAARVGDLLVGIPAISSGRHSGCRPRFGPDGFLWIGTGDAATGTNPQNLASLGGKVLRVDVTTGGGAPGNLAGLVYSYGHRNVQGLAFRPGSGAPFTVEHGPTFDDEVNVIVGGANYGWDPVPGYNETVPMTDLAKFPGAIPAVWSSGSSTIAASGGAFLSGEAWRDWDGAFAVAALKGRQLRIMFFDAANRLAGQEIVLTDQGRLRSPVLGPDGNLYVTTSNGGGTDRILRVTPS